MFLTCSYHNTSLVNSHPNTTISNSRSSLNLWTPRYTSSALETGANLLVIISPDTNEITNAYFLTANIYRSPFVLTVHKAYVYKYVEICVVLINYHFVWALENLSVNLLRFFVRTHVKGRDVRLKIKLWTAECVETRTDRSIACLCNFTWKLCKKCYMFLAKEFVRTLQISKQNKKFLTTEHKIHLPAQLLHQPLHIYKIYEIHTLKY